MNRGSLGRLNVLLVGLVVFITIFAIITIIAFPNSDKKFFHSDSVERLISSETFTDAFLFMLGRELPQFTNSISAELKVPSLPNLAFEAATGINTDNILTLLLQEIPGLNTAHTKFNVAGEGSNDNNIPQESPPPDFDELLKNDTDDEPDTDTDEQQDQDDVIVKEANPSVYIYHSHSWEAYLPLMEGEDVKPSNPSSTNNNENVVLVGSMLAEKLNGLGIKTVHNDMNTAKALRDKGWNYNHSYELSREQVVAVSAQHNSIEYFIDIHRDSARKESTTATINGKKYAKLFFVVGVAYRNYEQNLAFTKELEGKIEKAYPGISRGVYQKSKAEGNGVYNQDLSNHSILVEIGGVDNNEEELKNTIEAFTKIFQELYDGAIEVNG